ncbi:MAG TPA: TIM barrel protein [Gemmatimonadales bacterium]|nr:TIM barrel protein [Gemmatimonadales bacterium]
MSAVSRREALGLLAGAAGLFTTTAPGQAESRRESVIVPGRLKQSVCRWCYQAMPLEDLCRNAAAIGLTSVELLDEGEWPVVRRFGLTCAMANGPGPIEEGWNRLDLHDKLAAEAGRLLPLAAKAGLPNLIVFSGNRSGLSDADGIANCARGLARITPLAERVGVTLCLELLNSKVDHHDYQCDHTAWGVEVVNRVGSPRLKLLYDIYHMQIMDGDVIRTIRDNIQFIGHFHTGGVPGRGEIDDTQELNYRRICQAIVELGYQGYLGQEFVPTRDPMTSLRQGVEICSV